MITSNESPGHPGYINDRPTRLLLRFNRAVTLNPRLGDDTWLHRQGTVVSSVETPKKGLFAPRHARTVLHPLYSHDLSIIYLPEISPMTINDYSKLLR